MDKIHTAASLNIFVSPGTPAAMICSWLGLRDLDSQDDSRMETGKLSGVRLGKHEKFVVKSLLPDDVPVEDHILPMIELLEARETGYPAIKEKIVKIVIFCMFSSTHGQGSMVLSPDILLRLGNKGIELILDLYPPDSDYSTES